METLPWTLRVWEEYSQLSLGTLSGWKKGQHYPNESSLQCLLDAIDLHLPEDEKLKLVKDISFAFEVEESSDAYRFLVDRAKENYSDFLLRILKNRLWDDIDVFSEPKSDVIRKLLESKFQKWFLSESGISFESEIIAGRIVFWVTIKEQGKNIPPIVFSYADNCRDISDEEESIPEFLGKYKGEILVHIAATLAFVSDDSYRRMLERHHVYLKGIQQDDFRINEIENGYTFLKGNDALPGKERDINMRAEIIFKKFLDSSYLIYKEVMCWKYDIHYVNSNFFHSNLGIGNYPYAMRRAISFEKKLIEGMLEKRGKIDLLIDLNCLGGLYGLRLFRYARKVLCVDAGLRTMEAIKNTILAYNGNAEERKIVNVETELFRDDTCDILTNMNLAQKADCIVMGLGTMSYVKSPELLLRKVGTWLKEDGMIFLSCYNREALSVQLKRFENLNYEYDVYHERLVYNRYKINMPVPVRMFSFGEFRNIVMKYFDLDVQTMWSYPVISSIFQVNEYIDGIDIIKEVDKASAAYHHNRLSKGNYNMVIARQYQTPYKSELYIRTKSRMIDLKVEFKSIRHRAFVSFETLLEELRARQISIVNNFIKTVVMKAFSEEGHIRYYFVLLPAGKKFQWIFWEKFYAERGYPYRINKIRLCSEKELRRMGFEVGCICPFSYSVLKEEHDLEMLYDRALLYLPVEKVYTYSGKNDITYELDPESLKDYLREVNAYQFG